MVMVEVITSDIDRTVAGEIPQGSYASDKRLNLAIVSHNFSWMESAEIQSTHDLEDAFIKQSNETLFDVHNMLMSVWNKKNSKATAADQFGSFWLSTPVPLPARSPIHLIDSINGTRFDSDSYAQWRYHFTPLGVPYRVAGYGMVAKTLCGIDVLRFLDVHKSTYAIFANDSVLFIGNTNMRMARFSEQLLGAHQSRTSLKQRAREVVQASNEGMTLLDSLKRSRNRSYRFWMTGAEMFSAETYDRINSYVSEIEKETGLDRETLEHESRVKALMFMCTP